VIVENYTARRYGGLRFMGVTRYLAAQILGPMVFFSTAFTAVSWLRGSLPYLDLVVNRGQPASTFLEFTLLLLPAVIVVVLPIAFVIATIFTVQRLHGESELVVLWASGLSRLQIAKPVMSAAALVVVFAYSLALWINPVAQNYLKGRVFEIRGDIASGILQEGTFNSPMSGLTVYIRERRSDGELLGLLVHDSREIARPTTYMADRGIIVRSAEGPRLVMFNGTIQYIERDTGALTLLDFDQDVFDLSQFSTGSSGRWRKPDERSLDELFHPGWGVDEQRNFDLLIAEGHKRLSDPLYIFALPLVALAILMFGEFSRRGIWGRIAISMAVVIAARVVGLALNAYAVRHPAANLLLYLWPMMIIGAASYGLTDHAQNLLHRLNRPKMAPQPGQIEGR
jgi:lipopolysaccharide export system permease protein